ncbi:Predicted GTPase [Geoalkalibacter ferrihydriticus]|uniref:GTPase n=2 Tax=Geoalkalibacter ferrihydriticus TaxID=392333 RepID=A0A0C2EA21_9BACT|nr:cyclic 2,3-diphosphoglycerate synthase [Geoalkalibacter ferrihydriticus]KIH75438.1 GTPase [Geoalkalibacter ferrihydriticus DSM 17813]SDM93431.1 Predicted GTPase [Geoalkalibacter ferrihydriticus]
MSRSVVILGAAGRDFHNFNVVFRNDPNYRVLAFTAAQIPDIAGRRYPSALAGPLYPDGIAILEERALDALLQKQPVDEVVFAYSDVPHMEVMHLASLVLARGADFVLLGPRRTQLVATRPVISVGAVRTGCGKSSVTRKLCELAGELNLHPVVVRHPMPYGDLARQAVQRFASYEDLDRHQCTIEEREEYEPLLDEKQIVYAGVDYQEILRQAQAEADILIWDGGNNDLPFFHPDVHIVLLDPHRPGHERLYFPGESNLLSADIAIIAKSDSAMPEDIAAVRRSIAQLRPHAEVILGRSELLMEQPEAIRGKRVLVVEDGPSLTHGGMAFGAATLAARREGAAQILDPRPYAQGASAQVYQDYPHLENVLPAMGYGAEQMADLQASINAVPCDLVLFATPSDLSRLLTIKHPSLRVRYGYADGGSPTLAQVLRPRLQALCEERGRSL